MNTKTKNIILINNTDDTIENLSQSSNQIEKRKAITQFVQNTKKISITTKSFGTFILRTKLSSNRFQPMKNKTIP